MPRPDSFRIPVTRCNFCYNINVRPVQHQDPNQLGIPVLYKSSLPASGACCRKAMTRKMPLAEPCNYSIVLCACAGLLL